MLKQIIIGGLLGGITFFFWGFISWAVLDWHSGTVKSEEGINAVVENIDQHLPETGAYYFPPMSIVHQENSDWEAYDEIHKSGPSGMIFYNAEHHSVMSGSRLLLGFFVDVGAAMFASLLLIVALPSLPRYWGRMVYVTSLGVFSILSIRMIDGVFHHLPSRWTLGVSIDNAISWILVGFVLAALIRPKANKTDFPQG